ncbi:MerR family transcriptional regulator [Cohnella luojiensis]|uniref:MerR family transcriptional regulator n=1 Tax=Cohnella luojiensis TaxID=652876 RepID=A0A4Y8LQI9_9BACL|nr:MerR family transcriptional regulator [Cohnella luojiensis]TFE22674.1 MerR family transcriptional regulator [Cohnella luojiensis]
MSYHIKEITELTGLSASTLRFYEKAGVIPFVKRDINGNRIYDEENIQWMDFILALRETGMPINDIKNYVDLYKEGHSTLKERKEMMLQHKAKVEEEVAQIFKYLDKINYKLALYNILEANMNEQDIII